MLLDYSHYVQVLEQEECATFRTIVPRLVRQAESLGALIDGPNRFFPGDTGRQIVEYQRERITLFGDLSDQSNCRYCKQQLKSVHEDNRRLNEIFGRIEVRMCPDCGWWESMDEFELKIG